MRLHHKIARMFGYDLIHVNRNHPTIESHLQRLFKALDINVVLDVGGNTGQYGKMLRQIGYQGRIVSFEPVPECYETLRSMADERWEVHNVALGSENSRIDLNITQASAFTSFLHPNDYARQIRGKEVPVVDIRQVDVRVLDDMLPEILSSTKGESFRVFLKMDTQGYDLNVFQGASDSLDLICGLQSEISIIPLYEKMPDYIEAITTFRKKGFELTGLYPVTRDHDSLFLVELDCVMKKKN